MGADELSFFERVAEFDARRMSDVHNLYACPICLLWLRSLKPKDPEEDACPPCNGNGKGTRRAQDSSDDDNEEEEEEEEDEDIFEAERDAAACEPIETLYGSPMMFAWHARTGAAPEVGAAQCCFRHQSHLNQHLRQVHPSRPSMTLHDLP